MTEFYVEPAQLETLAVKQDAAAATAQQASLATTHLKRDTEQTGLPPVRLTPDL